MLRTDAPSRCSRWGVVASYGLIAGCANVVGLDVLVFDGEGGAGPTGVSSASNTAGALATTDAASSSGDATDASSSGASSSGETASSSSGSGGSGGSGFVVTGDHEAYRDLLRDYGASIWHLNEGDGEPVARDDGRNWDGDYLVEEGTLAYEEPGVFGDDTAVSFVGGARIEVPLADDKGYWFHLRSESEPFAIAFFAKLDGAPAAPITVMSCFDEALQKGWRILLGDEIVLERRGFGNVGQGNSELTEPFPFPTDGEWHFVVVLKARQDGPLRGYVDGVRLMEETSIVLEMPFTEARLSIGADPGADAATPALALDEVAFVFSGLDGESVEDFEFGDAQVDNLVECLQGGSCFRVD